MKDLETQYKAYAIVEMQKAEHWAEIKKRADAQYLEHIAKANEWLGLWSDLVAERSRMVLKVVK